MPFSSAINDKQQLSFIYQPGVGLYDKKIDQDLRMASTIVDTNERRQSFESSSTLNVDQRLLSSSPNKKVTRSCLRRQNEQDALPMREKAYPSNGILSDKNKNSQVKCIDHDISPNQENHQKRKVNQNLNSNKKIRRPSKDYLCSNEQKQVHRLSSNSATSVDENFKSVKNACNEPLKSRNVTLEQTSPIKLRSNSHERVETQSITALLKNNPMVKKSTSDDKRSDNTLPEKPPIILPSQGLLLCPKEEPIKKKKKKKITSTTISNTELLDDEDIVLDSILFNEMQSIQQQWQQFLILSMEKELHTNPSDGKKKNKFNKFNRTNEFLLAYDNLFDFDGMKHWHPASR